MFRPSEDADELSEHHLETPLRVLWRKLRNRQRLSDDELHFRNEIDNQSCIRSQRLPQCITPWREVRFVLPEQWPDQVLKGLCQRRVGYVALVLIELAGSEKASRGHQPRLQLVDDRGLADPRIARDQDQFRGATVDNALESGEQGLDLASAPVEFLRNQQPVGRIVLTKWKVINPAPHPPFTLAAAKVALEPAGGLIAVFGYLREQLHDDCRNDAGNLPQALGRCYRPPGKVAVHPFHGVCSGKRQSAGEHLVEGDAEGVEVTAGID